MRRKKIRKIIFSIVIPLLILDTTLLFAASRQASADDALLSRFQQQLDAKKQQTSQTPQPAQKPPEAVKPDSAASKTNEFFRHMENQSGETSDSDDDAPQSSATAPSYQAPAQVRYGSSWREHTVADYMREVPTANQVAAFGAVTSESMPMTPSQIRSMKRKMVAAQRASAAPAETPAKPVTSSQMVSLAPGATPPVIRLSAGFISTLVFVDAAGSNWSISAIDNGNPDAFNVSWDKKGSTIMIQSKKAYGYGNIAVSLKGSSTPVMLTLVPGQKEVDYRVDLRVSGLSPDSQAGVSMERLPDSANNELLGVLNNIPPQNATLLKVSGTGATVWRVRDKLFLRTRMVLLSPAYVSAMKSPDGTRAYVLQKTPSILVSRFGTPIELHVQGV